MSLPQRPPDSPKRRSNLFDRLCNPKELARSWSDVLAHYSKNRAPDDIVSFDRSRGARLERLARDLRSKQFVPEPASLIEIRKTNKPSELRTIALIQPEDRIVLTGLNRLLVPIFDRQFSAHSYAYRRGQGAGTAVERVDYCLRQGLESIATADIKDFFGSIDRQQLFEHVRKSIWDPNILDLIESYLHIGAVVNLEWTDQGIGIAQGSPLSPLLSNIYLLPFDRHMESLGVEWARYADNFILMSRDTEKTREAFVSAQQFLAGARRLKLNADSIVFSTAAAGFEFLGFWFQEGRRIMSPARLDRKKQALSETFRRQKELKPLIEELSESAKGWRNYYGSSPDTVEQLGLLEQHIFDLFVPWLRQYRESTRARGVDVKPALVEIQLARETDSRKKLKWVELLLARSRPEPKQAPHLSETVRKAVDKRKREVQRLKDDLQEIVITLPGTYLGRTGERLLIRREGKRQAEVPLQAIRNISMLTTAGSMSAELLVAAAARGISIHIIGSDGRPLVRIGPPDAPLFQLSAAQARIADSPEGLILAREFVRGKIRNQGNLLRYFGKHKDRRGGRRAGEETARALDILGQVSRSLEQRTFGADLDLERNQLFAAEAQAAIAYWKAVRALLWQELGFSARVHQGATDVVNAALNYGYGILYSRLMSVLVRTGLNPSIGFLHKPRPGKAPLLYDFIEEFRAAAVDRVVFSFLNLGKTLPMVDGRLESEPRQELARAVLHRLQANTRYHGETVSLLVAMEAQARLLVRHIEGKEQYEAYVLPW